MIYQIPQGLNCDNIVLNILLDNVIFPAGFSLCLRMYEVNFGQSNKIAQPWPRAVDGGF